jgi:hypothetical protein
MTFSYINRYQHFRRACSFYLQEKAPKHWYLSTRQHDDTSQKNVVLINSPFWESIISQSTYGYWSHNYLSQHYRTLQTPY